MAVIPMHGGDIVTLSAAQTGTGDSTNTGVRDFVAGTAAITVLTAVGATPTITYTMQCSVDGTNFFACPYATTAAPETMVQTAITTTTAKTDTFLLRPNHPWRYIKLNVTANTNVTFTATVYS
jgi:hypothetical protein